MVGEHTSLHVFAEFAYRQAKSSAQLLCEASILQAEQLERELSQSLKQDMQRVARIEILLTSPVTAYFDRLASFAVDPAHSTTNANAHDERTTARLPSSTGDHHRNQQRVVGTQVGRSQYTASIIPPQTSQAAILESRSEVTDLERACLRLFILERQLEQSSYASLRPAQGTSPLICADDISQMTRYYDRDLVSCSQRYFSPTARLPLLNDPIMPHWTSPVRSQIQ